MFDALDRRTDGEHRRRSAASLALTAALCGTGLAGFVLGSVLFVAATPPALEPPAVVMMIEPEEFDALVAPPGPPAPGRPDGPVDALPGLPAPEPEPDPHGPVSDPRPQVLEPGTGGGGGVPGGDPSGGGGGGDGGGGGGTRLYRHPNPQIRRQVDPTYPDAAKGLGIPEARCLAEVTVDEEGVPEHVNVMTCPKAFHPAVQEALLRWRWYPARVRREAVPFQTSVWIVFRLDP